MTITNERLTELRAAAFGDKSLSLPAAEMRALLDELAEACFKITELNQWRIAIIAERNELRKEVERLRALVKS